MLLDDEQKKAHQEQNKKKHEGMSSASTPPGNALHGVLREEAGLHYQNIDQGYTRKTSVYQGYPLHPQQCKVYQPNFKQASSVSSQFYRGQQPSVMDTIYQQLHGVKAGQYRDGDNRYQVGLDNGAGDSLNHLSTQLQSVLDFSRLPSLEEALSPSGSPPLPPSPPSFPLFSRHPTINEAQIWGLHETPRAPGPSSGRAPLHPLPPRDFYGSSLSLRRPWPSSNLPSPPAASSKPSLDGILCTSLVALTNKHREGKYWFKSGCPTPDPRWPAVQQLMAGPIPGDCDYSELRTAFLSHGQTCHLFIQNNQAWLERNQEKFGSRQVKFGYVVFTEAETAERLFRQGGVVLRRASGERIQVRVKRMDGLPAQFYRS